MASIFKATDTRTGQTVAIKVPYVQFESDVVFYSRFQREEEVGRRLNNPHIVKVLAPEKKSRMYIAMEYVDGISLRAHHARPASDGRPRRRSTMRASFARRWSTCTARAWSIAISSPRTFWSPSDGVAENHGLRHRAR